MTDIVLGADIAKAQQAQLSSLEQQYKNYNPTLYDVSRYFRNIFMEEKGAKKYKPLIGEDKNGITALLGMTLGKLPIILRSGSGAGKTVIMNSVMSCIPERMYKEIQASTATAIWNETENINNHNFLIFNELQVSGGSGDVLEILKTLGEGRDAHRNVTDVTAGRAGEDRVVENVINWKPFMTSVALENDKGKKMFDAELSRRMLELYTDMSSTQTRRINDYALDVYERGVDEMLTMEEQEIDLLKYHIEQCILFTDNLVQGYRFPAATKLADYIPAHFVQARSALPIFLQFVSAIAAFHYKDRIVTEDGILLVTPQDLYMAWECYGMRFLQRCLNMEIMADELLQIFPPREGLTNISRDRQLNMSEIKARLKEIKIHIGTSKLKTLVESFVDNGILDMETDHELDEVLYYKTGLDDMNSQLEYKDFIEHAKASVREQFPKYADDYIKRFCDAPWVSHPFQASKVNLITGDRQSTTAQKPVEKKPIRWS